MKRESWRHARAVMTVLGVLLTTGLWSVEAGANGERMRPRHEEVKRHTERTSDSSSRRNTRELKPEFNNAAGKTPPKPLRETFNPAAKPPPPGEKVKTDPPPKREPKPPYTPKSPSPGI